MFLPLQVAKLLPAASIVSRKLSTSNVVASAEVSTILEERILGMCVCVCYLIVFF